MAEGRPAVMPPADRVTAAYEPSLRAASAAGVGRAGPAPAPRAPAARDPDSGEPAAAVVPGAGRGRLSTAITAGSAALGALAATGLALFYAGVVGAAGGVDHLLQQTSVDAPWLAAILIGFGTQVALLTELRRRHRLSPASGAAAGGGATASAVGMAACCAHHIVDLVPVIGLSGAAVFLTAYRTPIMVLGIAINVVGVTVAAHRLRRYPAAPQPSPAPGRAGEMRCAAQ
jgi:hypothetical protein